MSERYLVLHALRLKGIAGDEALHDITGLDSDVIAKTLAGLVDEGLAKVRTGRITGAMLTREGRPVHADLLAEDVAGVPAGLAEGYDGFLPLNGRFKDLCTRWQLRPGGRAGESARRRRPRPRPGRAGAAPLRPLPDPAGRRSGEGAGWGGRGVRPAPRRELPRRVDGAPRGLPDQPGPGARRL